MAAEDLLNYTGLTYFKQQCDTKYATKAEAAHPIESIKVNGKTQTIYNKTADIQFDYIEVAQSNESVTWTDVGEEYNYDASLTNSTNGVVFAIAGTSTELVSKAYVDANGGKIDKVKVNGTEQTITNKEVNIPVPRFNCADGVDNKTVVVVIKDAAAEDGISFERGTDTVDVKFGEGTSSPVTVSLAGKDYVDGTFRTEAQVQTAINNALSGISGVSFQVVASLPATGENGIFYLVANSGTGDNVYDEYVWVNKGTAQTPNMVFEKIGSTAVDLTNYVQQSDINIITTAQIDALFT